MRKIITILFTVISFLSLSQNYPVRTKLKGDSVVIMTTEQYRDIELILINQRYRVNGYKEDIEIQEKLIDSLTEVCDRRIDTIDSLDGVIKNKIYTYDSLLDKVNTIEKWLYNASIDNSYMYYSYSDTTIMSVDLSSYVFIGNRRSGNFSLVRRGPILEDPEWKKYNILYPEEPIKGWELYYREKWRPVVIEYPYKIKL
jgi:hypothetical protein